MVGGGAWFNIWREHEGGTPKKTNYLDNTCTVACSLKMLFNY